VALSGGFVERDIASIRLPLWGRVVEAEGVVPWMVIDPDGNPVEPVRRFLRDFVARGNRTEAMSRSTNPSDIATRPPSKESRDFYRQAHGQRINHPRRVVP